MDQNWHKPLSRPIALHAHAPLVTLRDGADLLQQCFSRSHRTGALAYTLERLTVAAASGSLSDVTLATLQLRAFLSHQGLTAAAGMAARER